MINMSYCRFENTYKALRECTNTLTNGVASLEELSQKEREYAERLIWLCSEIAKEFEDDV